MWSSCFAIIYLQVAIASITSEMQRSGSQVVMPSGAMQAQSYINTTWLLLPHPANLGIQHNRTLRVLRPTDARLFNTGLVSDVNSTLVAPWIGDSNLGWPQAPVPRGGIPAGPRCRTSTKSAAIRHGLTGTNVSIQPALLSSGLIPAAATPQMPPLSVRAETRWPAVAPPVRAAEPYTVEQWSLVLEPTGVSNTLLGNYMGLWSSTAAGQRYPPGTIVSELGALSPSFMESPEFGSLMLNSRGGLHPVRKCAMVTMMDCPRRTFDPDCTPWDVPVPLNDTCRQTVLWPKTQARHSLLTKDMTTTPPAGLKSTDKHDYHIAKSSVNDSCRVYSTGNTRTNATNRIGACPPLPRDNATRSVADLDRTFSLAQDGHAYPAAPGDYTMGSTRVAQTCQKRTTTGNQKHGVSASGPTAAWQQIVTTVWPPGTVAVLPVGPNTNASGDYPDYPWRVNRAHVVVVVSNTPTTSIYSADNSSTTPEAAASYAALDCKLEPQYPPLTFDYSEAVFLDDPSCVVSRSCRPDVGSELNSKAPGYRQAVDAYVASDIARLFPTGMVGCALGYDLDRETYTTDLLPVDMPTAQNGAGMIVGTGIRTFFRSVSPNQLSYSPAVIGRNNASQRHVIASNGKLLQEEGRASGNLDTDETFASPVGVSTWNGVIVGPYAVYRGPVAYRMLPPSPNVSLPRVHGGRWDCSRTAPHGFFQERPYCLAVCDDPTHIAVDVGLEKWADNDGSLGKQGWRLVASQARQWYSYWLGYPGLVQDERLYQVDRLAQVPAIGSVRPASGANLQPSYINGTTGNSFILPYMRCASDDDGLWRRSWSHQARWAQRLQASRATVGFDLVFDRNSWPAAFTYKGNPQSPPGLQYPAPTRKQVEWMQDDVRIDVLDIMGLAGDAETGLELEIVGISVGPPVAKNLSEVDGTPQACTKDLGRQGWCTSIEYRVSVRAQLPSGLDCIAGSESPTCTQRGMSAGSLAQKLTQAMTDEQEFRLGGLWVMAVDMQSVNTSIRIPCLSTVDWSDDCRVPGAKLLPTVIGLIAGTSILFVPFAKLHARLEAALCLCWWLLLVSLSLSGMGLVATFGAVATAVIVGCRAAAAVCIMEWLVVTVSSAASGELQEFQAPPEQRAVPVEPTPLAMQAQGLHEAIETDKSGDSLSWRESGSSNDTSEPASPNLQADRVRARGTGHAGRYSQVVSGLKTITGIESEPPSTATGEAGTTFDPVSGARPIHRHSTRSKDRVQPRVRRRLAGQPADREPPRAGIVNGRNSNDMSAAGFEPHDSFGREEMREPWAVGQIVKARSRYVARQLEKGTITPMAAIQSETEDGSSGTQSSVRTGTGSNIQPDSQAFHSTRTSQRHRGIPQSMPSAGRIAEAEEESGTTPVQLSGSLQAGKAAPLDPLDAIDETNSARDRTSRLGNGISRPRDCVPTGPLQVPDRQILKSWQAYVAVCCGLTWGGGIELLCALVEKVRRDGWVQGVVGSDGLAAAALPLLDSPSLDVHQSGYKGDKAKESQGKLARVESGQSRQGSVEIANGTSGITISGSFSGSVLPLEPLSSLHTSNRVVVTSQGQQEYIKQQQLGGRGRLGDSKYNPPFVYYVIVLVYWLEVALRLSACVWAVLCAVGVCGWDACVSVGDSMGGSVGRGLASMPPQLHLMERLVTSGTMLLCLLCLQAASISMTIFAGPSKAARVACGMLP